MLSRRIISCVLEFLLVVMLSPHLIAQSQPQASTTTDQDKGIIGLVEFGGSSNSLGQVFELDGTTGYQFDKHFGFDVGVPVYFVNGSSSSGMSSNNGIGDPFLQLLFKAPNPKLNYAGTVTATAPIGDTKKGLSTGRVGIDFTNRFDHSFSILTPFVAAGVANNIHDTRFFRRPFTSLGFNAHFEAGADVSLGKYFDVGTSAYDILPSGTQKVFSKLIPQGGAGNAGGHGRSFGTNHETVGGASLTADHGFSAWVDASPNKVLGLELGYSRSVNYALNTVSFTVTMNVGQLARRSTHQ